MENIGQWLDLQKQTVPAIMIDVMAAKDKADFTKNSDL